MLPWQVASDEENEDSRLVALETVIVLAENGKRIQLEE